MLLARSSHRAQVVLAEKCGLVARSFHTSSKQSHGPSFHMGVFGEVPQAISDEPREEMNLFTAINDAMR
eukprot:CAMPEP_0184353382 /NCGR_PEP_ID=MMETSP1089-20130417/78289_1 /TAXON_ID=38269 ORGANISM="Gloeochaete wittrockiana, Strain SAG46.84" /NCGR_SAMPLE_ID=MMETSP1089 /ASSEMBLY_ACC=CAM_ASM_000445 /LENGTH=68 /DNA_ID=CAMNT_0026688735 /DNA_START=29 /DNA_END=231 /DNA_ORIENTATION=+